MSSISQVNDDLLDYEDIEITIGQIVEYTNIYGMKCEGEVLTVNQNDDLIHVLTGCIIKHTEWVHADELITY